MGPKAVNSIGVRLPLGIELAPRSEWGPPPGWLERLNIELIDGVKGHLNGIYWVDERCNLEPINGINLWIVGDEPLDS